MNWKVHADISAGTLYPYYGDIACHLGCELIKVLRGNHFVNKYKHESPRVLALDHEASVVLFRLFLTTS